MKRSRRENPADPPPTPPGGRQGQVQGRIPAADGAGGGFEVPIRGLCSGGDLVMSSEVQRDGEVAGYLREAGFGVEDVKAALKGFDDVRFDLYRVVTPWVVEKGEASAAPKTKRF